MSLCKECLDIMRKKGYAIALELERYPWLHCHHEEEKKECDLCKEKIIRYHKHISPGLYEPVICKYCPECGRKL